MPSELAGCFDFRFVPSAIPVANSLAAKAAEFHIGGRGKSAFHNQASHRKPASRTAREP